MLRSFRVLARRWDKVSPQRTSRRRPYISEEKDDRVLSVRMGWHGFFNCLRNSGSGTIHRLEKWRRIYVRLRRWC